MADFGLARYVLDDQYTSSGGTKFPIKWAPPEVLNYTRFSSKSDVWAYGKPNDTLKRSVYFDQIDALKMQFVSNSILFGLFAGVLMWEVFTCGKMPYGRLKNTEVVERVQRGIILERPKACAKEIYEVSSMNWPTLVL